MPLLFTTLDICCQCDWCHHDKFPWWWHSLFFHLSILLFFPLSYTRGLPDAGGFTHHAGRMMHDTMRLIMDQNIKKCKFFCHPLIFLLIFFLLWLKGNKDFSPLFCPYLFGGVRDMSPTISYSSSSLLYKTYFLNFLPISKIIIFRFLCFWNEGQYRELCEEECSWEFIWHFRGFRVRNIRSS